VTKNLLGLEDAFAHLVNSVRDYAIFLLDRSGHVASWNPGAERIKGYGAAEIIGEHFSRFYPDEARQHRWPEQQLELAERQGRFEDQGWRIGKDGRRFWADVVITALRDAKGELRGFAKITRDLSERREREESLRRSEERFRLLIQGVKDYAIFMVDRYGRVASWNAGAERMTGYSVHEIMGRPLSVFYPRDAVEKKWPEQELAMAREHGRFEDQGARVRKNGTTFWADVVVTPLYDAQGALIGYAEVTRDLTDRKRVEALEKAEQQTNEFLAMLAHELRNPLAVAKARIELARRDEGMAGRAAAHADRAHDSVDAAIAILERLELFSRADAGRLEARRERFELRPAIAASLERLRARGCEREVTIAMRGRPWVIGDQHLAEQAITNLLTNADRYSTPEGPIRIEVSGGDPVILRVVDAGPGIADDVAQLLFRDRVSSGRGLGLGLYLVNAMMQAQGGSARLEQRNPRAVFALRWKRASGAPSRSSAASASEASAPVER